MSDTNEVPAAEPSSAQAIYDRLLAQCNRANKLRIRLDKVIATIAARQAKPSDDFKPSKSPSYLGGLLVLADANDEINDKLEASIADLEKLF
jgi:hypothetical protein